MTNSLKTILSIVTVTFLSLAAPGWAEQLISDDLVVDGSACLGAGCVSGETFGETDLKIKQSSVRIVLEDTSTNGNPTTDWEIKANDVGANGSDFFAIRNLDANTAPFRIWAEAPGNAMAIDKLMRYIGLDEAGVGIGTRIPQGNLHIVTPWEPSIRLERDGSGGFDPSTWEIRTDSSEFSIVEFTGSGTPRQLRIQSDAPINSLYISSEGDIGLGTSTPDAPLEISDNDTFSFFRITATGASTNQSVDVVFTQGPLGTGELRYNIVDGDGPEMRLNANGDVTLTGTLTTAGPTCSAGCDRVFDADYDLRSIEEHAALMWENGHLPAVGPTLPGQPVNLTEKMGDVLNELEHAHIYIAELHERLEAQDALNADLLARLTQLEATQGKN